MMRYIMIMTAMLMVSCSGLELPSREETAREYPVLLNVRQDGATRIALTGNELSWEEGDEIQITAVTPGIEVSDTVGTSVLKLFGMNESDPSEASFTGFITLRSEPKACYFTHPVGEAMKVDALSGKISANYTAQNGSHRPFLYGKSDYDEAGITLDMKHLGAVLELDVETEGVARITLVGNGLEALSPVVIDPDDESIGLPTEAVNQITVDVRTDGKTYLFVPPVRFEKGFTLICSNEDGSSYFMKSYSDGSTGGYDFSSKRGVRIPVTISGGFENFALTASDVNVVHERDGSGLLTGTAVTFRMHKAGAPDRLIEGWGANLINERNEVVRSFSSSEAIIGDLSTLDVLNDRILLPAGTYTFQPYYIMYGSKVTMASEVRTISVPDPGVVISINGTTSYDKYKAGNKTGANSHTNTLVAGLSVSTNVAGGIISSYSASVVGKDNKTVDVGEPSYKVENSSTVASYGDRHFSKYQSYTMTATITVGDMTFNAGRTFHITGLPYEIDFRDGNDSNWGMSGTVKYSDSRMTFYSEFNITALATVCNGVIISPAFHLPENISVRPYADICCKSDDAVLHIDAGMSGSTSVSSDAKTITPHKIGLFSSLESKDYIECGSALLLSGDTRCLIYAVTDVPTGYNAALYRTKINYN